MVCRVKTFYVFIRLLALADYKWPPLARLVNNLKKKKIRQKLLICHRTDRTSPDSPQWGQKDTEATQDTFISEAKHMQRNLKERDDVMVHFQKYIVQQRKKRQQWLKNKTNKKKHKCCCLCAPPTLLQPQGNSLYCCRCLTK